jgi:hypothetical protein
MSAFDWISGIATGAARASVEISSNVSPPMTVPLYDDGSRGATDGSGKFEWVFRLLKPSIRVHSNFGDLAYAPWGEPDPDGFKRAAIVVSLVGTLFVGFAVLGLVRTFEGK